MIKWNYHSSLLSTQNTKKSDIQQQSSEKCTNSREQHMMQLGAVVFSPFKWTMSWFWSFTINMMEDKFPDMVLKKKVEIRCYTHTKKKKKEKTYVFSLDINPVFFKN